MFNDPQRQSDLALLRAWQTSRNPSAFHELVRRYANFVYATSARVLRVEADAEDVTQQCFITLATEPATVHTSVAAYLHRLATHRSLDLMRSEGRRRARERAYAERQPSSAEPQWDEISALIDEAIAGLPDELRVVMIAHFIEGKTQRAIARGSGCSRRVVGYRIQKGVEQVRQHLAMRGITLGATALTAVLSVEFTVANAAAPASLVASLGKIAVASAPRAAASSPWTVGGLLAMKKTPILLVCAAAIVAAVLVARNRDRAQPIDARDAVPAASANNEINAAETATTSDKASNRADTAVAAPETTSTTSNQPESIATSNASDDQPNATKPLRIATPAEYSSLHGIVVCKDDAFAGVELTLRIVTTGSNRHDPNAPAETYTTYSDALGAFAFNDIPYEGDAVLNAVLDGYIHQRPKFIPLPAGTRAETTVHMTPAFHMTGRLLDSDGKPVYDATLYIVSIAYENGGAMGGGEYSTRSRTDADGYFDWLVEGQILGNAAVEVESALSGNITLTNVPVAPDTHVELRYPAHASLAGRIVWADGKPAASLTVRLETRLVQPSANGGRVSMEHESVVTTTDAGGNYEFAALDSSLQYKIALLDGDRSLAGNRPLESFAPGEARRWDHTFENAGVIAGTVRGATTSRPLEHVRVVCVAHVNGDPVSFATFTGPDGRYRFELHIGEVECTVAPHYNREHDVEAYARHARVAPGDEVTLDFTFSETYSIWFQLLDPAGNPMRGILGMAEEAHDSGAYGFVAPAPTDDEGYVELTGLTPGTDVNIEFRKDGFISAQSDAYTGQPTDALGPFQVVMYPASGLVARVVDEKGALLTGAAVDVDFEYDGTMMERTGTTNDAGMLVMTNTLPAATGVLELELEGDSTVTIFQGEVTFPATGSLDFGDLVVERP